MRLDKRDIVWYWTGKTWRRGQITNVNRGWLQLKDNGRRAYVTSADPVVDGALGKPVGRPLSNHQLYQLSYHPHRKLLERVLIPS